MYHAGPLDRSWTYPAWFLRPLVPSFVATGGVRPDRAGRHPRLAHLQAGVGRVRAAVALLTVADAWDVFCLMERCVQGCCAPHSAGEHLQLRNVEAATLFLYAAGDEQESWSCAACCPLFVARPDNGFDCSLRTSQVPSLALLCLFMLILLFLFYRDYRSGAALLVSLVLCHPVLAPISRSNIKASRITTPASGQFLLAATLPIVSRDDVQPYMDAGENPGNSG